MTILIVLCHPLSHSFNSRIARTVYDAGGKADHNVFFHDLYRESFNPILTEEELKRGYSLDETVQRYMDEVEVSDVLVFIHPDWWGQMPALMKGWIDRVFRPGIAFDHTGDEFLSKQLEKLLTGKRGIAYCTTDSEESETSHPLIKLWEEKIFGYCGIAGHCRIFASVRESNSAVRQRWLELVTSDITDLLSG